MTCKVQQPARIDTDKIEYIVQTRIWNSEYIHAERFRFFFFGSLIFPIPLNFSIF